LLAHPSVNYVATLPGSGGTSAAFLGEVTIAFILMSVVLGVSNTQKLARFTGLFAGACVAAFITFEAPISGMSMNPAARLAAPCCRNFGIRCGFTFSRRRWGCWPPPPCICA
jgi:Glycerol uptake facilitator and related permeases (Major Intrinsic Protein Family)